MKKPDKPTLGEFFRTQCFNCGLVFEIPEPLTHDDRPDVRVYFGVCPRCQAPHCHVIGATDESIAWALDHFTGGSEAVRGATGQTGRHTGKYH